MSQQSQCRGWVHPLERGRYAHGYRDEHGNFVCAWTDDDPLQGAAWRRA